MISQEFPSSQLMFPPMVCKRFDNFPPLIGWMLRIIKVWTRCVQILVSTVGFIGVIGQIEVFLCNSPIPIRQITRSTTQIMVPELVYKKI